MKRTLILAVTALLIALFGCYSLSLFLWPGSPGTYAQPRRYMKNAETEQISFDIEGRQYASVSFIALNNPNTTYGNTSPTHRIIWDVGRKEADELISHFNVNDNRFNTITKLGKSRYLMETMKPNIAEFYKEYSSHFYHALLSYLENELETLEWEDYINFLLRFTQNIPYAVPPSNYKGNFINGLNPPPLLLQLLWGDCDSKAVLFSSILSKNPHYEAAFLEVPNHILIGIKGVPKPYQKYVEHLGEKYIVCEPVGPRNSALGYTFNNLRSLRGVMLQKDATIDPYPLSEDFFGEITVKEIDKERSREALDSAIALYGEEKWEEAYMALVPAVLENARDLSGFYYLGKTLEALEKEGSESLYQHAINKLAKYGRKTVDQYKLLGEMYKAIGEENKAYDNYYRAYLEDKEDYEAAYEVGRFLFNGGNYSKALRYVKAAHSVKPDYKGVKVLLGICYLKIRKEEEGIALIEEGYAENPNDPLSNYYLGDYYFSTYDREKAITYYRGYYKNGGEEPNSLLRLGKLLLLKGDYQESIEVFNAVSSLSDDIKDKMNVYYWRGLAKRGQAEGNKGSTETTQEDFVKAAEIARGIFEKNNRELIAYHYYGLAAAELTKDDAQEAYTILMKRGENSSSIRFFLQLALARCIEKAETPYEPQEIYNTALDYYTKRNNGFMVEVTEWFIRRM